MVEAISERFWEELIEVDPDLCEEDGSMHESACSQMFRGWSSEQLRRCLASLKNQSQAMPFLSPFPWNELGLDDYPQIVPDPIDLGTISKRLDRGKYLNSKGVDAKLFWADVTRCWINCKRYFESDEEEESRASCELAEAMQMIAEELEGKYWSEVSDMRSALRKFGLGSPTASSPEKTPKSTTARLTKDPKKQEEALEQLRVLAEQQAEEDRIIHNWCRKQLRLCLQTLSQRPDSDLAVQAASSSAASSSSAAASTENTNPDGFATSNVASLAAIAEKLKRGGYEDESKLTDPELFWIDVRRWVADQGPAPLQAAALELQEKFWKALDRFERSIDEAEKALSAVSD